MGIDHNPEGPPREGTVGIVDDVREGGVVYR